MKEFLEKINPLRIYRKHFAHKVIFAIAIPLFLFSIFISYYVISREIQNQKQIAMHKAEQMSTMVFDVLSAAMAKGNQRYLDLLIEEVNRKNLSIQDKLETECVKCHQEASIMELEKEQLKGIKILRSESLQKQFPRRKQEITPQEKKVLESGEETEVIEKDEEGYHLAKYIIPVVARDNCLHCHKAKPNEIIGTIVTSISLKETDIRIQKTIAKILTILIVSFLIIVLFLDLFFIPKILTKPIKKMAEMAKYIASGDLSKRIEIKRIDEIGELAQAFNRMAEDLQKTQSGVIQLEKMNSLGRMAAGVAHELNNPLTGVLGYAQLILSEIPKNDQLYDDVKIIEESAQRCKKIVANLLQFSRQREYNFEKTDLTEVIERTLELVGHTVSLQDIQIVKKYAEDLPPVNLSIPQMQQVFLNIILNAWEAMPKSGTLTISNRLKEDNPTPYTKMVEISIADAGIGMKKEILDRIFEPFFTTKEVGKGTGLGLSVAYGIIEKHKGRIYAESEGEGKGTKFVILLPIE